MRSIATIISTVFIIFAAHSFAGTSCNIDAMENLQIDPVGDSPLRSASQKEQNCTLQFRNGFPLPDPICTPGAINPSITIAVLKSKQFRTGCIRNAAESEHKKEIVYQRYNVSKPINNHGKKQRCELDHLVPLELGGADTLDNIWPQCGPQSAASAAAYFRDKDKVETYLAREVKRGHITLHDAQLGIAQDWTQFIDKATSKSQ